MGSKSKGELVESPPLIHHKFSRKLSQEAVLTTARGEILHHFIELS